MSTDAGALESAEMIEEYLSKAHAAYEADDSETVAELCRKVTEQDPDNADAWDLLAKFGGWNSRSYEFDVDFAVQAAKHALSLLPDEQRYDAAADIYLARKRQIALMLEAEMMMPSYLGAKKLHSTMMEWQKLLVEIPSLNITLLEGEIALCENLCARSKAGIMPGDRLVYTAYATLNKKESYGKSFRNALAGRLEQERHRNDKLLADARERASARQSSYWQDLAEESLDPEEEMIRLEQDKAGLEAEIEKLMGVSNRTLYQQQIEELEARRAKLPPYKLFKIQKVDAQLKEQREKMAQIDEELDPVLIPLRGHIAQIDARLAELEGN